MSAGAIAALAQIDRARRSAQSGLGALLAASAPSCSGCREHCCQDSFAHYDSEADYWLRWLRFRGNRPLEADTGRGDREDWAALLSRSPAPTARAEKPCFFLGPAGCRLPIADRPIRCVAYVCKELLAGMEHRRKWKTIRKVVTLCALYLQTVRVIRAEKRPRSGISMPAGAEGEWG